jgi:trigger factor
LLFFVCYTLQQNKLGELEQKQVHREERLQEVIMSFTVTTELRENRQLGMLIQVGQERVNQELQKAAKRISAQHGVPGFRKGKAPYSMVLRQYGLANLYSEFVEKLGQELYKKAIEQENIQPYAQASLEDVDYEPSLTYKLLIPMEPEVKLGDYRSLRLEESAPEIDEARVNERLEQYREQYADWRAVERPIAMGDMVTTDIYSQIIAEGDEQGDVVLDEYDWQVTLDENTPLDPPGLDEQLRGMSMGENKEFDLSWPEDSKSIHAGKTAHFTVTIKGVEAYEKPALNDELAQLVGPDFQTLDDLRANIRQSLLDLEKSRVQSDFADKALDAVIEISSLDYPKVMIEDQIDGMVDDLRNRLRQMGIDDINWYYQQMNTDEQAFRESLREQATKVARRNLVLSELLTAEKLFISDEELEERIQRITATDREDRQDSARQLADNLRQEPARTILTSQLLQEKGINRLLAIVRGEEIPMPASENAGEPAPESSEA